MCHISLENSQRGRQLSFRIHFNHKFAHKIMGLQSCEGLETKWHLGVGAMASHKKYYKGGRWWFPPSLSRGESCEFMFACDSFVHQKCSNYALINLLFGLCRSMWVIDLFVTLFSPHPEALPRPSTPKCYELKNIPQLLILSLFSPFGFIVDSIKEFGGASYAFIQMVMGNHFWKYGKNYKHFQTL